jgi:hypothetical protein
VSWSGERGEPSWDTAAPKFGVAEELLVYLLLRLSGWEKIYIGDGDEAQAQARRGDWSRAEVHLVLVKFPHMGSPDGCVRVDVRHVGERSDGGQVYCKGVRF